MTNELYHHGIKGMKWGVRRFQNKDGGLTIKGRTRYSQMGIDMKPKKSDSSVTRKVKTDYGKMNDQQFKAKYQVSKDRYAKRVAKYSDPYKNSPLVKAGKSLGKAQRNANRKYKKKSTKYKNSVDAKSNHNPDLSGRNQIHKKRTLRKNMTAKQRFQSNKQIGASIAGNIIGQQVAKKVYDATENSTATTLARVGTQLGAMSIAMAVQKQNSNKGRTMVMSMLLGPAGASTIYDGKREINKRR